MSYLKINTPFALLFLIKEFRRALKKIQICKKKKGIHEFQGKKKMKELQKVIKTLHYF